jgi:hypothetical protein
MNLQHNVLVKEASLHRNAYAMVPTVWNPKIVKNQLLWKLSGCPWREGAGFNWDWDMGKFPDFDKGLDAYIYQISEWYTWDLCISQKRKLNQF